MLVFFQGVALFFAVAVVAFFFYIASFSFVFVATLMRFPRR